MGLEPTPERHIERIVEICREVWRVLRDDGVFWLNYGDSYASGEIGRHDKNAGGDFDRPGWKGIERNTEGVRNPIGQGSLMMMPHRVALALQQDGWIVRQDLVWSKSNPMPESVNGWRWQREREKTDRSEQSKTMKVKGGHKNMLADPAHHKGVGPDWLAEYEYGDDLELRRGSWRHTRAHEYVFMLVKGMQYFSNQEAVREGVTGNAHSRGHGVHPKSAEEGIGIKANDSFSAAVREIVSSRNPRSVLDVPTAPYGGAHYATFPPNLIAPLIRATCPRWACPVCGQGWAAVVDKSTSFESGSGKAGREVGDIVGKHQEVETLHSGDGHDVRLGPVVHSNVLGYRPTCEHEHTQEEAVPGICFDPFVGSGTTVAVAQQLLRRGIGLDLSLPYLEEQAKLRVGIPPKDQLKNLPLFG